MRDDPRARARRVEVGIRLRALRRDRGLTQADLARAARMGQATLSNYEKGSRDIPAVLLVSVAGALELSIGEVLDVDHILIVRDPRMREAVRILMRSPEVLDSIVGPRPPPPPRPRRVKASEQDATDAEGGATGAEDQSAEGDPAQGGDDAQSAVAESAAPADEASSGEDESAEVDPAQGGDDGERADGEDERAEGEGTDAEAERADADDPGGVAPHDTGTQA